MMKKKFLLILVCVCCISFASMAQLTTGNNTSNVVRTGNRAAAGDFGLYFGTTSEIFSKVNNPNVSMTFLPLVNLKYMQSDKLEFRFGIELNKYSDFEEGTTREYPVVDPLTLDTTMMSDKLLNKLVVAEHTICPGIAYHFSKSNILDVYIGAEIPLGYSRYKYVYDINDSESYNNITKMSYHVGFGGFIGLQAYIANLPIAIGIEYGISSMFDLGLKYKIENKEKDKNVQITYESDLYAFDPPAHDYAELNARKGEIGSQFRITLTYFFKK